MRAHFTAVLLAVVALSACGDRPPRLEESRLEPEREEAAACGPVEQPPEQSGSHLIGDQEPPVPYSSTPPTSGWHAAGAFTIEVHGADDALPEPRQVSVLEAGGVVVTHHGLPDGDRARLEDHVRRHHDGRVAVTPYEALEPGQVAFAAWGHLQRCTEVDLAALDAFVTEHAEDEPHVPGAH